MPYTRNDFELTPTFQVDPALGESVVVGDYCYLLADNVGQTDFLLRIIDVSNPAACVQVGSCSVVAPTAPTGVRRASINLVVGGNYVYVCNNNRALSLQNTNIVVIDVTNKAAPVNVGQIPATLPSNDIRAEYAVPMLVHNDYLFMQGVGTVNSNTPAYIRTIDIATPSTPAIAGNWQIDVTYPAVWYAASMKIVSDYLYVTIYDTANEAQVADPPDFGYSTFNGFWVFDISDPENITKVGTLNLLIAEYSYLGNFIPLNKFARSGNYLYVPNVDRVQIVDISTPTAPSLQTEYIPYEYANVPNGDVPFYVHVDGNNLFIMNADNVLATATNFELKRFDISSPLSPVFIETIIIDNTVVPGAEPYAYSVSVQNNSIYVSWARPDAEPPVGWLTILSDFSEFTPDTSGASSSALRQLFYINS
jgi:hypothetical protein